MVPSRKSIEMKPELIIEARKISFLIIGVLDTLKHLVINVQLLPLVSRIYMGQ